VATDCSSNAGVSYLISIDMEWSILSGKVGKGSVWRCECK
jgi:hypothetical protein